MRALALFSSGLDSTLAIKAMTNQNIEVIALHFVIPFSRLDAAAQAQLITKTKDQLGVELKVISLGQDYLDILQTPRFGYGKNLNPCIDCKILMLRRAKSLMGELGASFVVTGEVVGQRPKSQHTETLHLIEKESGLSGYLLRPLSAKLLPETVVETQGWVDRSKLLAFHGRTRTPQIRLAKEYGIEEYAWPGGGCLLTVESFCGRVEDLISHGQLTLEQVNLLQWGRHFRLTPEYKLVVGRNQLENAQLHSRVRSGDWVFEPAALPGPTAIGKGQITPDTGELSSRIVAHYTTPGAQSVEIKARRAEFAGTETVSRVASLPDAELKTFIV